MSVYEIPSGKEKAFPWLFPEGRFGYTYPRPTHSNPRDYRDQLLRQAGIETRTGRKWSASQAVEQAVTRLRHRDIVGTPCDGRIGLVNNRQSEWKTVEQQERRAMIQQERNKRYGRRVQKDNP